MRICFISLSSYAYFKPSSTVTAGGAQRQLYLLSQELEEEFDVHFVVGDYGQPRMEERDGVTLHRAYTPDPRNNLSGRVRQTISLLQAMERSDADLFVYRGYPKKAAVTYGLAKLLGTPWVYHVADDTHVDTVPQALPVPLKHFFLRAIRQADAVVAQTAYQERVLRERYQVRARVIPNGYPSASDISPLTEREYFLWVGRIDEEQKRPHLYLDIAEQFPGYRFRLVGPRDASDTYHGRITERASKLPNVEDVGGVRPDEIHDLYRDAIALINTSSHEGFPNTFLEAWRYRTPVLSLDIDPGRLLDVDLPGHADSDFEQLLSLIDSIGTDVDFRKAVAQPAYERFTSDFRMSAVGSQYAEMLHEL